MKQRPTDEEFEELKRKRDDAVRETVRAVCEKQGWDPAKTAFHSSDMGKCYCACPDGPCQHIWDGPEVTSDDEDQGFWSSTSCSRCGAVSMFHDMRCMP
jgi:hypothetical protein